MGKLYLLPLLQASYFIFEKMKLEGFAGTEGDVRLRTVISIPQSVAGRVVGKGGKNVREIQRSTGSIITLPSVDSAAETAAAAADVHVEVFGNFIATQVRVLGKTKKNIFSDGYRRWRGTVVERRSLTGELSLSCARPAADG